MRNLLLAFVSAVVACSTAARAQDAQPEKYELRYKFTPGETLRWVAVHQGASTTKIKGHEQKSLSTSKSTKAWKVGEIDAEGHASIVYSIEDVEMWQQVGDRPEERYNSKSDEKAPASYQTVAATVGEPITEAVIDDRGRIVRREDKFPKFNAGIGDLATPLPEGPIAIGEEWHAPDELRIPVKGAVTRVKVRKLYKLEKVATGVATISVNTQVLTPVNDPQVEAQLMQHVAKGIIKFDVDAGRLLSRRLDWNETVLGFEGADSSMTYLARFTEELITDAPRTAANEDENSPASK